MPTFIVTAPDGKKIRVTGPEGATQEQAVAMARKQYKPSSESKRQASRSTFELLSDRAASWVPFADEAAGVGGGLGSALANAAKAPFSEDVDFDPVSAFARGYRRDKGRFEDDVKAAKKRAPVASKVVDVLGFGGSIGGPGRAIMAGAPTLLGRIAQGAKAGAVGGGIQGFADNEGADRLGGAAIGAGIGAGFGAALPVAGEVIGEAYRGARRLVRPENGLSREIIADAIADSGMTPRAVGEVMDEARARGVPLMLADTNENLRGLAGSVSRQPGPSRQIMRDALVDRQMGQGERVRGAIVRDLGPITDPLQASDDLIAQAQARAAPLYDEAYRVPGRTSDELQAVLDTPAGRSAITRARTIAANERRDPLTMGFGLNDQGETILTKEPSTQTLDYVKRGLDDLLEPYRNPITGRLQLDESGRAINQVRAQLVSETDRLNPVYGQARAAYAGPAREREALDLGRRALRMSPEEITRATSRLNEGERAQFALGFRTSLSDLIDNKVDGADKVTALLGTPKKREAIARVFGGDANFDQFVRTLADERTANETYRAIATGSQTANRLADDALNNDPGLLEQASGRLIRGGSQGGVSGAIAEAVRIMNDARRMGVGAPGKRVREEIAAILSETDPAILREALKKASRDRLTRKAAARQASRKYPAAAIGVGRAAGATTASLMEEPE